MNILFEDNHLFIVNKPADLLTQPTENKPDSLETRAKEWIKKASNKPGNVFLHAVHRLDRPASGIVVFAKTSKALSRLNTSIRNKEVKKHYLAYLERAPTQNEGTLKNGLIHDEFRARIDESGKPSSLFYRIKKTTPFCLVEIDLETGRYHQIRAQFSHIDCPILGDKKYGSTRSFGKNTIALHHDRLTLKHPVTGKEMTVEAPVPEEFNAYK